jgi:hypothetical protein
MSNISRKRARFSGLVSLGTAREYLRHHWRPNATTGKYQHGAGAVLPVGKRLFEINFHVSNMQKITEKYGSKVRGSWSHDDDLVSEASLIPNLTVNDMIKEYELTPNPAYIERADLLRTKNDRVLNRKWSDQLCLCY